MRSIIAKMKKLTAFLSIPFIAAVTSCAPKAPVEADYFTGVAPISIWNHMNASVKDFDGDGVADALVDEYGSAILYFKGYEKEAKIKDSSIEIDSELREDLTNYLKADNSLRYHAAKADYEKIKASYDSARVKK